MKLLTAIYFLFSVSILYSSEHFAVLDYSVGYFTNDLVSEAGELFCETQTDLTKDNKFLKSFRVEYFHRFLRPDRILVDFDEGFLKRPFGIYWGYAVSFNCVNRL